MDNSWIRMIQSMFHIIIINLIQDGVIKIFIHALDNIFHGVKYLHLEVDQILRYVYTILAKTWKKVHFGKTMQCLPQRLKSTFFEIILNGVVPKGPDEWRTNFKKVDFSLWGNRATTQTHIWNWIFFLRFSLLCCVKTTFCILYTKQREYTA